MKKFALGFVVGFVMGAIALMTFSQSQQPQGSIAMRWVGWRSSRIVLREQDIYVGNATNIDTATGVVIADRFRHRQFGPLRLERGPFPMP